MSIAKGWLKNCLTNHDCSRTLPGTTDLSSSSRVTAADATSYHGPSRLLDTKAFDHNCLDVRLIEHCEPGVRYATLSHCWGSAPNSKYQTLTTSLKEYMHKIAYYSLPATFRDAIAVCRALDIRYLWIDTLCIIQDSIEDRRREVAMMADVYGNSMLTISAAWARQPEDGCFNHRHVPQRVHQETKKLIRIPNKISTGETSILCFSPNHTSTHMNLDHTSLASRAWVFQKRILSRRNLHFLHDQLFWECRSDFVGEDLVPRTHWALKPSFLFEIMIKRRKEILHTWYNSIVIGYSSAELTWQTDRLPAISALAKVFNHHLKMPYLAGLWLEELWYGLSWYRMGNVCEGPQRVAKIAPSWSWAAVNYKVGFDNFVFPDSPYSLVEIEDTGIEHEGDPYGQISRGWIRIRGRFVPNVSLSGPEILSFDPKNMGDMNESDLYQLERQFGRDHDVGRFYRYRSPFLDEVFVDYINEPPLDFVDCLLLGQEDWWRKRRSFLLLRRTEENQNLYRRVGVATKKIEGSHEQWVERTITIV